MEKKSSVKRALTIAACILWTHTHAQELQVTDLNPEQLDWAAQRMTRIIQTRNNPALDPALFAQWADVPMPELLDTLTRIMQRKQNLQPQLQPQPQPQPTPRVVAEPPSWRQRYTLGPGDQLNLNIYGREGFKRPNTPVAPDGTITYLQAHSVPVSGLSLKQARQRIEQQLEPHYPGVRVMASPAVIGSKTYTIMGIVATSGVEPMMREVTLLEAIARAGGIVSGTVNGTTRELADLRRSFVIRNGQRLPVDFEALLLQGDLTHNISLEPRDYIYLQPALSNRFFLFGAVTNPGTQHIGNGSTLVQALAESGGFAPDAWRSKVLLVRGSLERPQSTMIDVAAVLQGRAHDIQLHPGDIVYVHSEPWYLIERILDNAIEAFLQSATSTWVDIELFDIDPNADIEQAAAEALINGTNN